MADVLRTSLEREIGYSTKVATNAFEAGMLADEFRPHVILFDLGIAESRAVLRALKSNPDLAATKVIAIGDGQQDGQQYMACGFESYLAKPFDLRTVVREIEMATNVIS